MRPLLASPLSLLVLAACACAVSCGCAGSRWAKSDPVYAAKYSRHSNNVLKTAKQAIDARHVRDRGGFGVATTVGPDPLTLGGELSAFSYSKPWLEARGGLMGVAGTGDANLFGGLTAGLRIQTPSRLAPFAGVGAFLGGGERDATDDGIDNDNDCCIDEPGEDEDEYFASVFPEVGAHFWLNPRVRLTTSAAYHVTTSGRDDDQWLLGVAISFLSGPSKSQIPTGKLTLLEDPDSWQPGLGATEPPPYQTAQVPASAPPRPVAEPESRPQFYDPNLLPAADPTTYVAPATPFVELPAEPAVPRTTDRKRRRDDPWCPK